MYVLGMGSACDVITSSNKRNIPWTGLIRSGNKKIVSEVTNSFPACFYGSGGKISSRVTAAPFFLSPQTKLVAVSLVPMLYPRVEISTQN